MAGRIATWALALGMALAGLFLAGGGALLIAAGGSWYYLPAGLALLASAVGLALRKRYALPLYGALLVATLAWAIWEAQWNGWALVPRLVGPAVLGLILLVMPFVRGAEGQKKRWVLGLPVAAIAATLTLSAFTDETPDPAALSEARPAKSGTTP